MNKFILNIKTKCFITGATGFIGKHLVIKLLKENIFNEVYYLCRTNSKNHEVFINIVSKIKTKSKLIKVNGDLVKGDYEIPFGIRCVFHLAGSINTWGKNNDKQIGVNIDGSRILIKKADDAYVNKFIHIGTVDIFDSLNKSINERTPYPKKYKINYDYSKKLGMEEVLKYNRNIKSRIFIHPGMVVGEYDVDGICKFMDMVVDVDNFGIPIGSNSWVDVKNLIDCIVNAYFIDLGEIEHFIVGGENLTNLEFANKVCKVFKKKKYSQINNLSPFFYYLIAFFLKCFYFLKNKNIKPKITYEDVHMITKNIICDSGKAIRILDLEIGNIDNAIRRYFKWKKFIK